MARNRNKYFATFEDIEFCVESFNKCYTLSLNVDWTLPEKEDIYSSPSYEIRNMKELDDALFQCKSQLNNYNSEDWRIHTKRRNLIASLMHEIRSRNATELFIQSWPKLWEILYKFKLIPEDSRTVNSVHLCEAPGAFVSALNHYLKQNRPTVNFNWWATSLNPYFEDMDPGQVINDDRIIMHTLDHWEFGPDNTGNIFNVDLVEDLIRKTPADIHLVTADGSQDNISSKEAVVANLLLAEALAALRLLSKGGHFVLKIFTVFECHTANLVYLLCCSFDEVQMFKPISSREANSEVYLVCKGYRYDRGDEQFQSYLKVIENHDQRSNSTTSMFPFDAISPEFIEILGESQSFFGHLQMQVINGNIATFPEHIYKNDWYQRKCIREEIAKRFLKMYPLDDLPLSKRLCPFVDSQLEKFEVDNSYLGSWQEENVIKVNMSMDERRDKIEEEFQTVKHSFEWPFESKPQQIYRINDLSGEFSNVGITKGARVRTIRNSRFITKRLLNFFHSVLELGTDHMTNIVSVKSNWDRWTVTLPLKYLGLSLRRAEKEFVENLLIQLKSFMSNESTIVIDLVFINVLLIGQRSVGIIYSLCKVLDGTGTTIKLNDYGELIIADLTKEPAAIMVKELEKFNDLMDDEHIHGFVDWRLLRQNEEPNRFYDLIKIFNNLSCVKICGELLSSH